MAAANPNAPRPDHIGCARPLPGGRSHASRASNSLPAVWAEPSANTSLADGRLTIVPGANSVFGVDLGLGGRHDFQACVTVTLSEPGPTADHDGVDEGGLEVEGANFAKIRFTVDGRGQAKVLTHDGRWDDAGRTADRPGDQARAGRKSACHNGRRHGCHVLDQRRGVRHRRRRGSAGSPGPASPRGICPSQHPDPIRRHVDMAVR